MIYKKYQYLKLKVESNKNRVTLIYLQLPLSYGAVCRQTEAWIGAMVQSRWDDAEAAKCNGDLLALRVYSSRLMCAPTTRAPA